MIILCTKLTSAGGSDEGEFGLYGCAAAIHLYVLAADIAGMRKAASFSDSGQSPSIPWALQMRAISRDEPGQVVKILTGAILGSGGWVLSRSASDSGLVDILFEFERESVLEIYSILIAAGLELSKSAHVRFTELCQCVRLGSSERSKEIVSLDLEIQTMLSGETEESPAT